MFPSANQGITKNSAETLEKVLKSILKVERWGDVMTNLAKEQIENHVPKDRKELDNGKFVLLRPRTQGTNEEELGSFCIDERLIGNAISRGFAEKHELAFEQNITREYPKERKTGEGFIAMGVVAVEMMIAGSNRPWKVWCRVMPYRRLCKFDEENPEESKTGFMDVILGQNFLEEVNNEANNAKLGERERKEGAWEVKEPKSE